MSQEHDKWNKHKYIMKSLSKADVDNEAPMMLTCGKKAQGHGTPTYTYGKRENNKRKKEISKLYAL